MLFPFCYLDNHPVSHQISYSVICLVHIYSDWKILLHLTLTGSFPKCVPLTGNSIHYVYKAPPPFFFAFCFFLFFADLVVWSLAMSALRISFLFTWSHFQKWLRRTWRFDFRRTVQGRHGSVTGGNEVHITY